MDGSFTSSKLTVVDGPDSHEPPSERRDRPPTCARAHLLFPSAGSVYSTLCFAWLPPRSFCETRPGIDPRCHRQVHRALQKILSRPHRLARLVLCFSPFKFLLRPLQRSLKPRCSPVPSSTSQVDATVAWHGVRATLVMTRGRGHCQWIMRDRAPDRFNGRLTYGDGPSESVPGPASRLQGPVRFVARLNPPLTGSCAIACAAARASPLRPGASPLQRFSSSSFPNWDRRAYMAW